MIVYHGSNIAIAHPDLLHSRKNVDFGQLDRQKGSY